MRREVIKASAVVFVASFCTLVIELVAGRIMAPYVGVSLYTCTSIIGVVLDGNIVGKIYAFSILGSILGTFATGFFLISWMGTRHILFTMGVILMLSGVIFGGFFVRRKAIALFLALFLGGGGYTFPRFLEAKYPGAEIDVAEIDPEVTQVARKYLGISENSRIRSFNQDGRWFLMNCEEVKSCDFIFGDVLNYVPVNNLIAPIFEERFGYQADRGRIIPLPMPVQNRLRGGAVTIQLQEAYRIGKLK